MLIVCPIFDRIELLPHFLQYYTDIGATEFELPLWNGSENPNYNEIKKLKSNYDIQLSTSVACPAEMHNGRKESDAINLIRVRSSARHRWLLAADLDEFCYFGGVSLPGVIQEADRLGCTVVHGPTVDRFPETEVFPEINYLSLDKVFPAACDITKFIGACVDKVCLTRTDEPIRSGRHSSAGRYWVNRMEVHHFKWSAGIFERLTTRDQYYGGQQLPWAGESRKHIGLLKNPDYRSIPELNFRPANRIGTRPLTGR